VQRQATGARTPEELATQFEDAFMIRDRAALAELFDERAVLVPHTARGELRGSEEIARFAAALWRGDRNYLAEVRRVVQAGDSAAVVLDWSLSAGGTADGNRECGRGVDVLQRENDGSWRYVISLLDVCS
jgi:ketosteroid isomerase-like protein